MRELFASVAPKFTCPCSCMSYIIYIIIRCGLNVELVKPKATVSMAAICYINSMRWVPKFINFSSEKQTSVSSSSHINLR